MFKNLILTSIFILINNSFITAQNMLHFSSFTLKNKCISAETLQEQQVAQVLEHYLNQAFGKNTATNKGATQKCARIYLKISKEFQKTNCFTIRSNESDLYLIAPNEKFLRYAMYTLLEIWGFRKFTANELYIPGVKRFTFPVNTKQTYEPSFDYRTLLYPDAYDADFRDWHKLDWFQDDFAIWGHSFETLIPSKKYFTTNPDYFAFYEGARNAESICMTNDEVFQLIVQNIQNVLDKKPNRRFLSLSQNDDVVFCECSKCNILNAANGGPQGSLYYFLNRVAEKFPKTNITTLAYLHTFKPPVNLKIATTIYPFICPIDLNRGKPISTDNGSTSFRKNLVKWAKKTKNQFIWDYTVSFSNYLSPFPNIHTFSENFKFYKKSKIKGLFVQGYADVPGDLSELRQYILAKLLWDSETDVDKTTDDFLKGFYGKAAIYVKQYLLLLSENQIKSGKNLDIYASPIHAKSSFLNPQAMDDYDQILANASAAVENDPILTSRIEKLRLALEYVYFEQAKFYGNDQHGMFTRSHNGEIKIKDFLNERVQNFFQKCSLYGIYELNEAGLSPKEYYDEWLLIAKNTSQNLGQNIKTSFITPPSDDFIGKGASSLTDGILGYKDFNINWIGWYGNNPELELTTNNLDFNEVKINFLSDQRHWIFLPKKISIWGSNNSDWSLITEKKIDHEVENLEINVEKIRLINENFSKFEKIKIIIENHHTLPSWRKRKNKKPMIMIDEIELFKKSKTCHND